MKKFALFGHPIDHSLSPHIHHDFAAKHGILLSYIKIDPGMQGFTSAIKHFQQEGADGANITSPFKEEAVEICDELSDRAKLAKSVNTITFQQNGKIYGDNTDGIGLITDIQKNIGFSLASKRVLILGAGGAARGIIPAILDTSPAIITVANRTPSKAAQLAVEFHGIIGCGLEELKHHIYDVVINATNAAELKLPANILSNESLCYDLSYATSSPFLDWAKENGAAQAHNGYGMLKEQAFEAFKQWHKIHTK